MISTDLQTIEERATVSDLFFNHQHPNYEALFEGGKSPTRENLSAAIRLDADGFARQFGGDPEWYAEDFMRRL